VPLLQPTSGGNLLSQRMRWYPVLQYTRPDVVWTRHTHIHWHCWLCWSCTWVMLLWRASPQTCHYLCENSSCSM